MSDFRVKLLTIDGSLIQNRKSGKDFWINSSNGRIYREFADISIEGDCREKGVRLISYEVTEDGVTGLVEWL